MSFGCTVWVMDEILVPYTEWAVLFHMSDGADDEGRFCTIDRNRVAWTFSITVGEVEEAVDSLVGQGIIEKMSVPNDRQLYKINFDAAPKKMPFSRWLLAKDMEWDRRNVELVSE